MEPLHLHRWDVEPTGARQIQAELAPLVVKEGSPRQVRTIAGVDVSAGRRGTRARGAVVLLSYPALDLVEVQVVETVTSFPYIPGLLSFREVPVLAGAFRRLTQRPDLLFVDGQGYAHPRRFGLACHLGLIFDVPTIGCAKSRLIGDHAQPAEAPGSMTDLSHEGELIGKVVRTRAGVKPVFVSIGHKVSLEVASEWVIRCCRGYRLPEPTRRADMAAGGTLSMRHGLLQ